MVLVLCWSGVQKGKCCFFMAVVHKAVTWANVSYFHVGLVCSLSPEQEGPEGVGVFVSVCFCLCVSVHETIGKLKRDTHVPYFLRNCPVLCDFFSDNTSFFRPLFGSLV